MSDTSIYSKLTEKELLSSIPAEANLFAEVNGETKRVPGYAMDIYAKKEDLESLSSLPSGSSPNQYLITDSEGVAGWADPTWEALTDKPFYEKSAVVFSGVIDYWSDNYTEVEFALKNFAPTLLTAGKEYKVNFAGYDFDAVAEDETYLLWTYPGKYDDMTFTLGTDSGVVMIVGRGYEDYLIDNAKITVSFEEVKQLDESFIPSNIARTADIPEVVQSDMAVNDPDDPAYVKNRTHWVEETESETLIPEISFTGTWVDYDDNVFDLSSYYGKPVEVVLDGVRYSCTVRSKYTGGNDVFYLGSINHSSWGEYYTDNIDLPFFIGFGMNGNSYVEVRVATNESHSLHVYIAGVECHPLSPSLGGMPTLAEDGSDAGKFVMANADGTGYELVSMTNVAEEGA